jgi:hypothetical protein
VKIGAIWPSDIRYLRDLKAWGVWRIMVKEMMSMPQIREGRFRHGQAIYLNPFIFSIPFSKALPALTWHAYFMVG